MIRHHKLNWQNGITRTLWSECEVTTRRWRNVTALNLSKVSVTVLSFSLC